MQAPFSVNDVLVVAAYRGDPSEAMIGRIVEVRDILARPLSKRTLAKNKDVLRSQYLITVVDLESTSQSPVRKSFYDAFLTLAGVPK